MTPMTPPRLPQQTDSPSGTGSGPHNDRAVFPLWQTISPCTALSDLYTTSLLVVTNGSSSGVLVRCSPGQEKGSAVLVHASTRRPDSLHMLEMDDDSPIGEQAHALADARSAQVLAIPHITWRRPAAGLAWRTPITLLVVLLSVTGVLLLGPPLSTASALPIAAATGLLAWLLLRGRVPTSIASSDGTPTDVANVVAYAQSHVARN